MLKASPTFRAPSVYVRRFSSPGFTGVCMAQCGSQAIRCGRNSLRGCDRTVPKCKRGQVSSRKFLAFSVDGDGAEAKTNAQGGEPVQGFDPEPKQFDFEESELETEEKLWAMYERWISYWKVSRSAEEKRKRFSTFKDKAHYVHTENKMDMSCKVSLNKFADMSRDEFRSKYVNSVIFNDFNQRGKLRGTVSYWPFFIVVVISVLYRMLQGMLRANRTYVDRKNEGIVTAVKDQGSRWLLSTLAAVVALSILSPPVATTMSKISPTLVAPSTYVRSFLASITRRVWG